MIDCPKCKSWILDCTCPKGPTMKKVTANLFRGPRPEDPKELLDNKIGLVVCLQSGFYDYFVEDKYDDFDFAGNNIQYCEIECSDIFPPSRKKVDQAISTILRAQHSGKKVFIHCLSGVDRTGYMIAVWRMRIQGWDFERAHKEWVDEGRHWHYFWWKWALKKWSKK